MVNELLTASGSGGLGQQPNVPNHMKGRVLALETPTQSRRVLLIATTNRQRQNIVRRWAQFLARPPPRPGGARLGCKPSLAHYDADHGGAATTRNDWLPRLRRDGIVFRLQLPALRLKGASGALHPQPAGTAPSQHRGAQRPDPDRHARPLRRYWLLLRRRDRWRVAGYRLRRGRRHHRGARWIHHQPQSALVQIAVLAAWSREGRYDYTRRRHRMTKFMTCKSCGSQISKKAAACPHCGHA